jgi:hypothetical protein
VCGWEKSQVNLSISRFSGSASSLVELTVAKAAIVLGLLPECVFATSYDVINRARRDYTVITILLTVTFKNSIPAQMTAFSVTAALNNGTLMVLLRNSNPALLSNLQVNEDTNPTTYFTTTTTTTSLMPSHPNGSSNGISDNTMLAIIGSVIGSCVLLTLIFIVHMIKVPHPYD